MYNLSSVLSSILSALHVYWLVFETPGTPSCYSWSQGDTLQLQYTRTHQKQLHPSNQTPHKASHHLISNPLTLNIHIVCTPIAVETSNPHTSIVGTIPKTFESRNL